MRVWEREVLVLISFQLRWLPCILQAFAHLELGPIAPKVASVRSAPSCSNIPPRIDHLTKVGQLWRVDDAVSQNSHTTSAILMFSWAKPEMNALLVLSAFRFLAEGQWLCDTLASYGYQRQVVLISGPVRPEVEGIMGC